MQQEVELQTSDAGAGTYVPPRILDIDLTADSEFGVVAGIAGSMP